MDVFVSSSGLASVTISAHVRLLVNKGDLSDF